MNKRRIVLSTLFSIFMVGLSLEAAPAPKKPWTFLVYIAGANNLADFVGLDLNEMMKVGSNANVHILAYTTVKKYGKPKQTNRYEVQPGQLKQIGTTTVEDSGSVDTLIKALEWAQVEYPSDHLAVVLWDHGSGTLNPNRSPNWLKGICWDDTTGNYLTDRDCYAAFEHLCTTYRKGKKIDIVACDACLMASLELAYTFGKYVKFFVASEENIPGYGFQYSYVLAPFNEGSLKPIDLAKSMVKGYDECYKDTGYDYTLSAVNLKKLNPLITNLNQISQFFVVQLTSQNKTWVKKALASTITPKAALHFGDMDYLDLYQWLKNVYVAVPNMNLDKETAKHIKRLIKSTLRLASKPVFAHANSANYSNAHGMSVYLPSYYIDPSYGNLLWTDWTEWTDFLKAYIAA